jgi:hypothetical protein
MKRIRTIPDLRPIPCEPRPAFPFFSCFFAQQSFRIFSRRANSFSGESQPIAETLVESRQCKPRIKGIGRNKTWPREIRRARSKGGPRNTRKTQKRRRESREYLRSRHHLFRIFFCVFRGPELALLPTIPGQPDCAPSGDGIRQSGQVQSLPIFSSFR